MPLRALPPLWGDRGEKDFRCAGNSGLEGGGDLVWDERLRNQLLLVALRVLGSDGRLDSVGGVRKIVRARTRAQPETPPSAWAADASPVTGSMVVACNFFPPWSVSQYPF